MFFLRLIRSEDIGPDKEHDTLCRIHYLDMCTRMKALLLRVNVRAKLEASHMWSVRALRYARREGCMQLPKRQLTLTCSANFRYHNLGKIFIRPYRGPMDAHVASLCGQHLPGAGRKTEMAWWWWRQVRPGQPSSGR